MKKLLAVLVLIAAMLHTSVLAAENEGFMKCSYEESTNSVRWEEDLFVVNFTGNTPAKVSYNDTNSRVAEIVFPGPVQVQLTGVFDIALLHKTINGEASSENLFTGTTRNTTDTGMEKDQTNAVMLTDGEYTLAFIVNYGTYADGDHLSIKVGNGVSSGETGSIQQSPQESGSTIAFDRNRDSYITTMKSLPEGAQISDWATGEVNEAFSRSIVPQNIYHEGNYQRPVTRKEFSYIMVGAMQSFNYTFEALIADFDKYGFRTEFTDTDNDLIIQIARFNNIINGTSDTTFSPDGLLTREQAAAMLERLYSQCQVQYGIGKPIINNPTYFADRDQFSSWAVESINFVSALAEPSTGKFIMGGVGNDEFQPAGNLTVEQALIATKRMISFAENKHQQIQSFINSQKK